MELKTLFRLLVTSLLMYENYNTIYSRVSARYHLNIWFFMNLKEKYFPKCFTQLARFTFKKSHILVKICHQHNHLSESQTVNNAVFKALTLCQQQQQQQHINTEFQKIEFVRTDLITKFQYMVISFLQPKITNYKYCKLRFLFAFRIALTPIPTFSIKRSTFWLHDTHAFDLIFFYTS